MDAHRLALLRPAEIAARLSERSVVYLPLGTLEFHAQHLPIGLDALNAEGICLRAATEGGGLVHPTLYYGTGGSHAAFPWSIIMPAGAEIEALLA
jgi:creatinine amidohydrolase